MSSLRLVKFRPQADFTMLPNEFLCDPAMSGLAKWAVAMYWSRPDGWRASTDYLETVCTDGRQALRTALTLAEEQGYLYRDRRCRGADGRFYTLVIVSVVPMDPDELDEAIQAATAPHRGTGSRTTVSRTSSTKKGKQEGNYMRGAARPAHGTHADGVEAEPQPRRRGVRRGEPELDDGEEAPAYGADPNRKTRAERNAAAKATARSGQGLALRLQEGLATQRGALATVDVGAVAKRLVELHRRDVDWDVIREMVDLFVREPSRWSRGDQKGGWAFLAALPRLQKAADNVSAAQAGGTRYGGAYDDLDDDGRAPLVTITRGAK